MLLTITLPLSDRTQFYEEGSISRFGMEVMRASPRQADFMIISGTVTKKMVPQIVRLYNQMGEPKYVMQWGLVPAGEGRLKKDTMLSRALISTFPLMYMFLGAHPHHKHY